MKAVIKDLRSVSTAYLEVNGQRVENARCAALSYDNEVVNATFKFTNGRCESEGISEHREPVRTKVQRQPRVATRRADNGGDKEADLESA